MRNRYFSRIGFLAALLVAWSTVALALPGEVTNLAWCPGTKTCLQWSAVGGAGQYEVYRGELASLPCVLAPSLDSCDHGAVASTTTGSTIPENPPAGRFFWFIVTAVDGSGEGTAGSATAGPRQVEDTGACAPSCAPSGSSCSVGADCCSSSCSAGTCDSVCSPCLPTGGLCSTNSQCCSTACISGACAQCAGAAQCPGVDTECQARTCTAGSCGFSFTSNGTPIANQVPGDCQVKTCDGAGGITVQVDDSDVPPDDGNQCTNDLCSNGNPIHPFRPLNSPCAQEGGAFCSGNGMCVECNSSSQCPGTDNECRSRTCSGHVCGTNFVPAGTPTGSQNTGDCRQNQCDGSGNTVNTIDNSDVPVDGYQCTSDDCTAGTPSNPPLPVNSPCNQEGGVFCSGTGTCVECNSAAQCPGIDGECRSRACTSNTCGTTFAPFGTTCSEGGGTLCNGSGTCVPGPAVVATVPVDGASVIASTPISVTFNQAMNPATLTGQTTAGACSGSIQVSTDSFASCVAFAASAATMSAGDTIATFQPAPGLLVNRTYQIRVTTAAQNGSGLPLASTYTQVPAFTTFAPNLCDGSVVISQVYGGGGQTGATYRNDFVELHNRGTSPVTLTGKSIQYASAAGTTWNSNLNLSGTIAAGGYFLIQLASNAAGGGAVLPVPDQTGTIDMAGSSGGKVAFVRNTTQLSGSCPLGANVLDFVGYGTANCSEGGVATGTPSVTTAPTRQQAGCRDSDINGADFTVLTPSPRNSASASNVCSCVARNESNVASEADYCTIRFPVTLTVQAGTMTPQVFGQVFESGVTDPPGANAAVVSQLGFGPVTVNPEYEAGWTWGTTPYNLQVGNNDEYQGQFTAPATPGSYRYTYRFSLDSGTSWTYCDTNGAGGNVGLTFDLGDLGPLTVTP